MISAITLIQDMVAKMLSISYIVYAIVEDKAPVETDLSAGEPEESAAQPNRHRPAHTPAQRNLDETNTPMQKGSGDRSLCFFSVAVLQASAASPRAASSFSINS